MSIDSRTPTAPRRRPGLVLGPLLRYVDETTATVWVETDTACRVDVAGGTARTFEVAGHHYALVVVSGLRPGTSTPYEVHLDGNLVWPEPGSSLPASRIRTPHEARFRLVFGSCRRPSQEHDVGPDALLAYAHRLSGLDETEWPHALLLLGDQVYADEPSPETREWLRARHENSAAPPTEVVDFEEYARLYHEAWSEPLLRWLLSTLPTSMIFDDHDVRDDWNTSRAWRERMRAETWWPSRIRGALVSYWVYQHIGNLSPRELETDELFGAVTGHGGDTAPMLAEFAASADSEAGSAHWSYRRDFGRVRLLVIDTRAGRMLEPGERTMLDETEFDWVERNTDGEYDHLLLGSSLPWLLPDTISELQSVNELACERPGRRGRLAETLRQAFDLEHWPAFRDSFARLAALVRGVASSADAPATVTVLSGDVHHHYAAEAVYPEYQRLSCGIHQLTCSPIHNRAPAHLAWAFRVAWWRPLAALARLWSRRAGVRPVPLAWRRLWGPRLGNAVATIDTAGRESHVVFEEAADNRSLTETTRIRLSREQ